MSDTTINLTEVQAEKVRKMRNGATLLYYWADGDYCLNGFTQNKSTFEKLKELGIIHKTGGYGWHDTYTLTSVGESIEL